MTNIVHPIDKITGSVTSFLAFEQLSTIDRNSLIRIGKNIEVSSLSEMKDVLDFVIDFSRTGSRNAFLDLNVLSYLSRSSDIKPFVYFTTETGFASFLGTYIAFRFAATAYATKEVLESGGEGAIRAHLESLVDSHEAIWLHHVLSLHAFDAGSGPSYTPQSLRDVLSRVIAGALDLEPGASNVFISIPSFHLYPLLYETDVEPTPFSGSQRTPATTQWFQNERWLDTNIKLVKVAMNSNSFIAGRFVILAYTDYLVKSFKRYYLNSFFVSRAKESSLETNRYRLTYDRYVHYDIPLLRTNANNVFGGTYTTAAVGVYHPGLIYGQSYPISFNSIASLSFLNNIS